MSGIRHGENVLPYFGGKVNKVQYLRNSAAGQILSAGDFGLRDDLAGFQLHVPLKGLLEEQLHPGYLWFLRRFPIAGPWRHGAYNLVASYLAGDCAYVGVLEGAFRPQGNLDGLFYLLSGTACIDRSYVDNTEVDFRLGAFSAKSKTGT